MGLGLGDRGRPASLCSAFPCDILDAMLRRSLYRGMSPEKTNAIHDRDNETQPKRARGMQSTIHPSH